MPTLPIISYPLNNLKDTRQQTLIWNDDVGILCNKCKYIIAVYAIRESRLSVVVKQAEDYTIVPP